MPIWITATGVGCIGVTYGYMLFYSFRRHQTPLVETPMPMSQVLTLLGAIGAGGAIGGAFLTLEGVNYFGAYGIGLLMGVIANICVTIYLFKEKDD